MFALKLSGIQIYFLLYMKLYIFMIYFVYFFSPNNKSQKINIVNTQIGQSRIIHSVVDMINIDR